MSSAWLSSAAGAALADHLWQSTVAAGVAALLVRALRKQSAQLRFRIWLAASLKFLIPFSLLVAVGRALPLAAAPPVTEPVISVAVETFGQPFSSRSAIAVPATRPAPAERHQLKALALVVVWMAGAVTLLVRTLAGQRRVRASVRRADVLSDGRELEALRRVQRRSASVGVRLLSVAGSMEPGVFGVFQPVVLWPANLTPHLGDAQLEAILAHELAHVRRRDNLTATLHLVVQAAFWFHPMVWWLESKLIDERERACDEDVLRAGAEPQTYAESILTVCRFCLRVPVTVVAGVAGSNLKQRVEDIMTARIAHPLTAGRRALLAIMALVFLGGPVAVGALTTSADPLPVPMGSARVLGSLFQDDLLQGASPIRRAGTLDAPSQYAANAPGVAATSAASSAQVSDLQGARDQAINTARRHTAALYDMFGTATAQTPQTISDYLDAARRAYDEGRLADVDDALKHALAMLHDQTAAQAPPAPEGSTPAVRAGGDVREPLIRRRVQPIYPADARAAGLQGYVLIEATIGTDGSVRDARVMKSNPAFDQAALDAVSQWLDTPTSVNSVPVEVIMTVMVQFTLQ